MSDYKHRMSLAVPQALDMMVLYDGTQQVTTDTIVCAVDYEPLPTLEAIGLSVIEEEDTVYADNTEV